MATFECKVYELTIEEHPNADALELARVGDYLAIVGKGQFKTGDLGVYIPEAAIVPDWILEKLNLVGKLAGKERNRVKAMKLRGILSQGLIYPVDREVPEKGITDAVLFKADDGKFHHQVITAGENVAGLLAITKYEPPIPSGMSGDVFNAFGYTINFDIENIKKYPDVLEEGEQVSITEKLHGTWCCFGYHPEVDCPIVTSKGQSAKGLAFKHNETNEKNLYMQMYKQMEDVGDGHTLLEGLQYLTYSKMDTPVYILGEIYGKGVQDLAYVDDNAKYFRAFDIYVGEPSNGQYLPPDEVERICRVLDIDMVPVLYCGPYSKEVVEKYTNGKETVSGKELHMREGVVIRPHDERRHDEIGRVILKSVSEAYLLRKGGTEFN
jgi:RNA ligase (TIGR02306 family)